MAYYFSSYFKKNEEEPIYTIELLQAALRLPDNVKVMIDADFDEFHFHGVIEEFNAWEDVKEFLGEHKINDALEKFYAEIKLADTLLVVVTGEHFIVAASTKEELQKALNALDKEKNDRVIMDEDHEKYHKIEEDTEAYYAF